MEGREGPVSSSGGVTVVGSDAPSNYHVAPRLENPTQTPGSTAGPSLSALDPTAKKKRGRPRKYAPDGSAATPLSPKPISTAAPPVIDFSGPKRGKVKRTGYPIKPSSEDENSGPWVTCSIGTNFTPHIIMVNAGEDVTMKVISFSQQGPRAICILSANGVIASVTLRQADSSGGTLTYEGRFEILSLSGSFMPNDVGGTRSRSGGMSVSLAGPDGRVVGGGVAGLLIAASPIQVVVGSFLTGNQHEQKPKKQEHDVKPGLAPTDESKQKASSTSPTTGAAIAVCSIICSIAEPMLVAVRGNHPDNCRKTSIALQEKICVISDMSSAKYHIILRSCPLKQSNAAGPSNTATMSPPTDLHFGMPWWRQWDTLAQGSDFPCGP